jgi:hypothetical protein
MSGVNLLGVLIIVTSTFVLVLSLKKNE